MMQLYVVHSDEPLPKPNIQTISETTQIHPNIQLILNRFPNIFKDPTTLPPTRYGFDHKIPLKEGSNPINLRPYRYPIMQKGSS